MTGETCRLVTWNVHGFVGSDGRWNPQRAIDVLAELDPDLVALQEVDARPCADSERHPLDVMADGLEATAVAGPTLGTPGSDYGNAVLSRLPVVDIHRHDLSWHSVEPRGAIDVRVRHSRNVLRLVTVHFGLRRTERIAQAELLRAILQRPSNPADIMAVAGDLNSWWPRAREARIIEHSVGPSLRPRTFPSRRPVFRLDRVFVRPPAAVSDWGVADNAEVRGASDHLPVWVDVDVGQAADREPRPPEKGESNERR